MPEPSTDAPLSAAAPQASSAGAPLSAAAPQASSVDAPLSAAAPQASSAGAPLSAAAIGELMATYTHRRTDALMLDACFVVPQGELVRAGSWCGAELRAEPDAEGGLHLLRPPSVTDEALSTLSWSECRASQGGTKVDMRASVSRQPDGRLRIARLVATGWQPGACREGWDPMSTLATAGHAWATPVLGAILFWAAVVWHFWPRPASRSRQQALKAALPLM